MDRFKSLQPLEEQYREFDFDDALGTATIASATVSAKIVSTGVDVTATLTTVAKQDITTDTSSCFVWCIGLTDGVDYQITCKIVASDGTKHELEGLLLVSSVPAIASTLTGPGLIAPPLIEPISLAELKLHLYVDDTDHDSMLESILITAREHVENITGRYLLTQTQQYCLSGWPDKDYIKLPGGNLQSVSSIKWKDTDGTSTTLTLTTDYLVERNGAGIGRIVLPYGVSWPSGSLYPSNPITIEYVCGWTTAALVPYAIKAAIKLICADLYEMRGEPTIGQIVVENKAAKVLLASYKLWDEF
jgi:uncharacterized phiE125 gp8 family phage protein